MNAMFKRKGLRSLISRLNFNQFFSFSRTNGSNRKRVEKTNNHENQHSSGLSQRFVKKKDEEFKMDSFNSNASRYAIENEEYQELVDMDKPSYLKEKKRKFTSKDFNELDLKSGERMKGVLPKQDYKAQKKLLSRDISEKKEQKASQETAIALAKQNDRLLNGPPTTAINRNDLNYIEIEKKRIKNSVAKLKKAKILERKQIINSESVVEFQKEERLSKRLSRLGVCSRRQADKLIQLGMVRVNGEVVSNNTLVDDTAMIKVQSDKGFKTPMPQTSRIWLYYKPAGFTCDFKDELNRPSIVQLLRAKNFELHHYIIVGKLDINSEGLVILTNNGDVAKSLEVNDTIERGYKVRVFGRMFSEEKLRKIRQGVTINMKEIRFWVELIRKQSTNTWLHVKTNNNNIHDIRNVFRKLSLRVNRLIRVTYGPFGIGSLKEPNVLSETKVPTNIRNYLLYRYKEKTKAKIQKLDNAKLEKLREKLLTTQKITARLK